VTYAMARAQAVPKGVGWGFRQTMVGLAAMAFVLPVSQLTASGALPRAMGSLMSVIVRTDPTATASVERTVRDLGGKVDRPLGIISGLSVEVPASALPALSTARGVLAVSQNAHIKLFSIGGYDPTTDVNSVYNVTQMTGAQAYWKAGYTGKNVDVALLDTGVVPVNGLTANNKVVTGPDLSFDSQYSQLRYLDGYGHGTHMAGIIAGRDDAAPNNVVGDTNDFVGMAPDSRIVSVRVGDHTGAADVSQVIAAIDWIVQHKNDNGMNIRVLNLSFGTDSQQPYVLDPLAYAAEQAWKHGIVVVASVGNGGANSGGVADPAMDPYVIAVGASDTNGTVSPGDDSVASFSSYGNGVRNPDLVAPGVHVASLRDPGSFLDTTYGSTADVGTRFFRGSGTSQATAVVSGAAALVISQHPNATPDQVKALLTSTSSSLGQPSAAQGSGELNLNAALNKNINGNGVNLLSAVSLTSSGSQQTWAPSVGSGTLQGSRGSVILSANGVDLTGEQDIFGKLFTSAAMAAAESTGSAWSGGTWNGSAWSGSGWSGSAWSGSAWSTTAWSGSAWSGSAWSGSAWSGSAWSGSGWSGSGWSGSAWSGSGWSGSGWSGSAWSGSGWSGSGWSGSGWSGSGWAGSGWSGTSWA
jgi:serine protease AprX